MKKLASALVLSMGLLASCGGEKPDVVNLSYVDAHWTVNKYSLEQPEALESVDETLQACTGDLTTELKGDLTVYDTVIANRHQMTDTGDEYAYKSVTYIKGDEHYALCRDMLSERFQAEVIESFPPFVDTQNGKRIQRNPFIEPADETTQAEFLDTDGLLEPNNAVEPFPDTIVTFIPAFHGEVELTIGDRPVAFPVLMFDPMMAHIDEVKIAIGYHPDEKKPYVLLMLADLYFTMSPLDEIIDPVKGEQSYEELTVKRLPLRSELLPDKSYPLYEFNYTRDGKAVTEIATITYRASELLTISEQKALKDNPDEQYMPSVSGPLIYLHQQPFNHESTLTYPTILRAVGNEMDDLIQAIDSAEPTKRTGDQGNYPYLTIVDGLKGQEFEVTYKQRSKKLDIYVTDRSTKETYKLTSEGAETFLSYFPDLKTK
ncbi:hypothetical protein [Exiguobacterium sp. s6]|uniref:hypothetical protein n=1 Tax=Exiguobacterium sp. s6 TaxID=2751236 RepID=UPI001BE838BB|nr:hypothetical protein [Exiguobacterium sp. s6]